ncbi:MAG TPA: 3'-5' exonuclease [bacterium]|nr:3'-5' exonuclease [bacterium]
MKLFFCDVETTGINPVSNAITQFSGILEIDGEYVDQIDIHLQPHEGADIEDQALEVQGITRESLKHPDRLSPEQAYNRIKTILDHHIDKYQKTDKLFFIGYNCLSFDMPFTRKLFERNGDNYFGSWFWFPGIDVMAIAAAGLMDRRHKIKNFKLATVCEAYGIQVDPARIHDSMYDIEITRQLYDKIMHRES